MGYGSYTLPDGREAGYLVSATCDAPQGCEAQVFRGHDALCGESPDGYRSGDAPGCGLYLCGKHERDHDCANPVCGAYSPDGEWCGLRAVHDLPHVDAYDGTTFTQTEDEYLAEHGTLLLGALDGGPTTTEANA